jgi:hypothetical protein
LEQVQDDKCIFLWGFKIAFGGQRSTGFGVIYDNLNAAKKSLSKHLLLREKVIEKVKGKFCKTRDLHLHLFPCSLTFFFVWSARPVLCIHVLSGLIPSDGRSCP